MPDGKFKKGCIPWNKGLNLSEKPQYSEMGFQKGHTYWDNQKTKATQFKEGQRPSQETEFQKGHIPWHAGKKGLPQFSGVNNPAWIEDRNALKKNEKKHLCVQYRNWMFAVKNRDSWQCKISNESCSGRLEAHHILNWIDYPELRYQVNNGITLCQAHHPRKWAEEKRLVPVFQELVSVSSINI